MVALHLIRHGQASFGADDYDRLSALGIAQGRVVGRQLGARLGAADIVAVSGSLNRHRDTAAACLEAMGRGGVALAIDPDLNEYDPADVVACHRPDLADAAALRAELATAPDPRRAYQALFAEAVARWMGGQHDGDYTECWPVFRNRVLAGLARAAQAGAQAGNTVLVFTSGGPIMAAVQAVLGLDDAGARHVHWALVNGGVTKLLASSKAAGRVGAGWSLSSLNEQAGLDGPDGLLTYR
ncbi:MULTISPECIES: histidine phosphatase family protein [Nitrospirillum]|uniref:Broad specificity phosphatase PhoE n=1 Tax=Nitrospirillum amazonense TaxID=28077 RepID=A0A560G1Q7_9PROT|nr:phosphoglycerate mutase family protein [Nitrospirillum amazonense]MEC4589365.1 phosphoglycerate mutase family protein [Nitrospirillum amazonense]TWB27828.1 broad specificity phosphatase PhoE [Nitrospirillum amazonense]